MANPTLYKKETLANVNNRTTTALSNDEQTTVSETINKFFTLFASFHS